MRRLWKTSAAIFLAPWEHLPSDPALDQLEPILVGDLRAPGCRAGTAARSGTTAFRLRRSLATPGRLPPDLRARHRRSAVRNGPDSLVLIDEEALGTGVPLPTSLRACWPASSAGPLACSSTAGRSPGSNGPSWTSSGRTGSSAGTRTDRGRRPQPVAFAGGGRHRELLRPPAPGGSSSSVLPGEQTVLTEFHRIEVTPGRSWSWDGGSPRRGAFRMPPWMGRSSTGGGATSR